MASERRGAAALDGTHHFKLSKADMAAVGIAPSGTVIAENIRGLQHWPGHGGGLGGRLTLLPWRLPLAAERAFDGGNPAGSHTRVARRRIELVVAQNRLDQTDIQALLEKMGGEGMPERMQRYLLLDARRNSCLVEQARELTRGDGLAALAAREKPALLHRHAFVVTSAQRLSR